MQFLVLGGGIAAVQCVEELARIRPDDEITLLSSTRTIKGIDNVKRISRTIEEFQVVEKDLHALPHPNITAVHGIARAVDTSKNTVVLTDGSSVPFHKLCICTGAIPKRIAEHPLVLVLRDRDSVEELSAKVQHARKIVLVGNGGIAMELAHALQGVEVLALSSVFDRKGKGALPVLLLLQLWEPTTFVEQLVWVVKQGHIGDAFFDSDAAAFLRGELDRSRADTANGSGSLEMQNSRQHISDLVLEQLKEPVSLNIRKGQPSRAGFGHAVGPQWAADLRQGAQVGDVHIECDCTISSIADGTDEWPVSVKLSNGKLLGADFVICAVGVTPNTEWLGGTVKLHPEDRGILVDRQMQSSTENIYAAGDVCCIDWPDLSQQWFQMRLWTQAKMMGNYAAHCMAGTAEAAAVSFTFELFTHVTRLLGMKVVLLGLYDGQKIPDSEASNLVSYSRCVEGPAGHFVRVLLHNGRMVGAVLIGETELEETFENLILDGLDLSRYGPALLDPDVEIDHMFD